MGDRYPSRYQPGPRDRGTQPPWQRHPAPDHRDHGPGHSYQSCSRADTRDQYHTQPREDYHFRSQINYYGGRSRDSYRGDHYQDSRQSQDTGYLFRGAADRHSQELPAALATHDFDFRNPGPPAPRFTSVNAHMPNQPRIGKNDEPSRGEERHGQHRSLPLARHGMGQAPRSKAPFGARPAHQRAILKSTGRATTPEQLEGMNNEGMTRFKCVDLDSGVDLSDFTSRDHDESDCSRKRAKVDISHEVAKPKWSNPDPYTALPPPDTLGAPKRDIVQMIRKAKVEIGPKPEETSAVKENADFISLSLEGVTESQQLSPRGQKRKEGETGAELNDKLQDMWLPNGENSTPWLDSNSSGTSNVGLRLHKEIVDFYNFVKPYEHEEIIRRDLIARVQKSINASSLTNSKGVKIESFGSFAAGLYLPTADMDLVAISTQFRRHRTRIFCQSKNQMYALKRHLEATGIAPPDGVVVIWKAKVPIIKYTDKLTGIRVDISFENDSGLMANKTFQEWKQQYPAMPVIVILIKQMLAMRGLNEVFHGGIGGFTVISLVVSMMQLMPEIQTMNVTPGLYYGDLLLNFLELYGKKFDVRATGISLQPPGYFDKTKNPNICKRQNPRTLTIIDPNNSSNDISGGSRNIEDVLDCFHRAHSEIQRRLAMIQSGENVETSILGSIVGGNYTSFFQHRARINSTIPVIVGSLPPPTPPFLPSSASALQSQADLHPMHKGKVKSKTTKHPLPAKPTSADDSKRYGGRSYSSNTPDERSNQALSKQISTQKAYKSLGRR